MWRPTAARPRLRPLSSRTRPPRRRPHPSDEAPAPSAAPAEDPHGGLLKLKELPGAGALTQPEEHNKILSA